MLDVRWFRGLRKDDLQVILESQRRRGLSEEAVHAVVELYEEWRRTTRELQDSRAKVNALQKSITALVLEEKRKRAENGSPGGKQQQKNLSQVLQERLRPLKKQIGELKQRAGELEKREEESAAKKNRALLAIPNIVAASVPVSMDEADNRVLRYWPTDQRQEQRDATLPRLTQRTLCNRLGIMRKMTKVSGGGTYCLVGGGATLHQRLQALATRHLSEDHGYTPILTPAWVKKDVLQRSSQIADFAGQMYGIQQAPQDADQLLLIATSEQPITAMHQNETIMAADLPIRYCAISPCFRRETGDDGGLFRVHQFDKVEQMVLCAPHEGWAELERSVECTERLLQKLGIAYRVVEVVSGKLARGQSRKLDIEAWFPGYGESGAYREVASCSVSTDYYSRALGIRYAGEQKNVYNQGYVWIVSSTCCAIQRTMSCLLETYQTKEGVQLPKVLGSLFLPFKT